MSKKVAVSQQRIVTAFAKQLKGKFKRTCQFYIFVFKFAPTLLNQKKRVIQQFKWITRYFFDLNSIIP